MPSGYSDATVTAGSTITATWGNLIRDSVVSHFATAAARDSAITSPAVGMVCFISDDYVMAVYNGMSWVMISPVSDAVATSQTTTSTSYANLSTTGPSVTVETDTKALVTVSGLLYNSGANNTFMSFAVSGATTRAAVDLEGPVHASTSGINTSVTTLVTGLTAGNNVFTVKYRVAAGTGTFEARRITVVGIP